MRNNCWQPWKHAAFSTILLISLAFAISVACTSTSEAKATSKAFDPANMNLSVRPGDDFYQYVDGGWIKNHPVPANKSLYDDTKILDDETNARLKVVIEEAANNTTLENGSNLQKIATLYRMGMDTATIDKQGIDPLKEEFGLIQNISTPTDVQAVSTRLLELGIDPLFHFHPDADAKNSKVMVAILAQGGLGLPDRDYYFRQDNDSVKTRAQYLDHVTRMFELLGDSPDNASKNARTIMRMETRLANVSFTNVDDRDAVKTYNKMNLDRLKTLAPGINWTRFVSDLGRPDIKEIDIMEPSFVKGLGIMMQSESVADWKTFLRWNLISATAPYLGAKFENESFDFYGRKLNGQEQMEPRWKRVINRMDQGLGEAIGRLYVEKYFDPESKVKIQALVGNLKLALRYRIQNLTWMENSTKAKALNKLDKTDIKVGYPDKWRDYSGLLIKNDSYVRNTLATWSFEFYHGDYGIDKIGKPVDPNVWELYPQEVNAGEDPVKNVLFFPAGILQPPFFSKDADDAINYGGIGAVIGHEMTHGFDDQGRKYDENGNLTDWWTENDAQKFNESSLAFVDEYNKFEPLPGLFINGNLTLGENIADFGGLTVAYQAYKLSQKADPERIDGFTGDQRFFLGFAQSWRTSIKDEMLRTDVQTDVHSPAKYRVDGVVFNMPEFYKAFQEIKPGDKMYRPEEERPVIW